MIPKYILNKSNQKSEHVSVSVLQIPLELPVPAINKFTFYVCENKRFACCFVYCILFCFIKFTLFILFDTFVRIENTHFNGIFWNNISTFNFITCFLPFFRIFSHKIISWRISISWRFILLDNLTKFPICSFIFRTKVIIVKITLGRIFLYSIIVFHETIFIRV